MYIKFFLFITLIINIYPYAFKCPSNSTLPESFEKTKTYSFEQITENDVTYTPVLMGNSIWIQNNLQMKTVTTGDQENICPKGYRVPYISDFEEMIANLSDPYSAFTNTTGFNLSAGRYAVTNSKADSNLNSYLYYVIYVNGTSKKVEKTTILINKVASYMKCVIETLSPEIEVGPTSNYSPYVGDQKYFYMNDTFLLGTLWRINNNSITKNQYNISYTFENNGINMIENWHYDLIGNLHYKCKNIFVDINLTSTLKDFNYDEQYSVINTTVTSNYNNKLHFTYSNAPVAPRLYGGYYIAFRSDKDNCIHVLSYDKNNILLKNFNTTKKGYVFDIVATTIGFAIYMKDEDEVILSTNIQYHSYILVYNINFELVYTKNIMNNNIVNKSNINSAKQINRHDISGEVVNGMQFMYDPMNAKFLYTNGRIFLIFSYTNYENGNGDTIVTFDDFLKDIDYGAVWGTFQSLNQVISEEKDWVWTVTLSDNLGLDAVHVSKINFTNNFDAVAQAFNEREYYKVNNIFGTITYIGDNQTYVKVGGLMYLSDYSLLCLVFAQTNDAEAKHHGIFLALFSYSRSYSSSLYSLLELDASKDIYNIRAGHVGNNIIILYSLSSTTTSRTTGDLPKGSPTYLLLAKYDGEKFEIVKKDVLIGNGYMGTNEDMRNFKDGRLIWTSIDANGNILIHRLGTLNNDNTKNDDDDIIFNDSTAKNEDDDSNNNINSSTKPSSNDSNKSSSKNSSNNNNSKNQSKSSSKNNESSSKNNQNSKSNNSNNNNDSKSNNSNNNSKSNNSNKNNDSKGQNNNNSSESKSNSKDDNENSSSSEEKESKLLLIILIVIIGVLLISIIVIIVYLLKKKPSNNENDNKNDKKKSKKKKDDHENDQANNTHVSQANSNVNFKSNLESNNIAIYKDLENKN